MKSPYDALSVIGTFLLSIICLSNITHGIFFAFHFPDSFIKHTRIMKINAYLTVIVISILTMTACQPEEVYNTALDDTLEAALIAVSETNSLDYFILPDADDLARIPQDPKNQLTPSKVALGKLLFHETGLALNPVKNIGMDKYSCASCHLAKAGFQAGRVQGIGEGGVGTGIAGEGRSKGAFYTAEEVDVQAIRTPSTLNGAYQVNQLWNGQFGATGKNVNTSEQWTAETPKATNHLGYEGLETQAIAGLKVHRLNVTEAFLAANNYIELFDDAFPNIPTEDRYNTEQTALAIAAYERTLLANEAPFQRWLKGDISALSDQEKQGAILFFKEGKCANCHTGPALNSMEFYALGMNDLYTCAEGVTVI